MSNSDIYTNKNETALIIANGEACNTELMNELLKKSSLIIVLDSAMDRVIKLGIKVDVLLGDFDREYDTKKYLKLYNSLEIVHIKEQNSTDLEKAFMYLIEKKYSTVNVIWATGRRMDHTIANMTNIVKYSDLLDIKLFDDYSTIYRLPNTFSKYYTANTPISLIPVGTADGITTKNLVYPLLNEQLTLGYRSGSSNSVKESGFVKISYTNGDLLMMECKD